MTTSAEIPFGVNQLAEILRDAGFPLSAAELAANPDTQFADWGVDSLAQLELAAGLQRLLGRRIDDDEAARLVTPRATLEVVAAWQTPAEVADGRAH